MHNIECEEWAVLPTAEEKQILSGESPAEQLGIADLFRYAPASVDIAEDVNFGTGDKLKSLSEALRATKSLTNLSLSSNSISADDASGEGMCALGAALASNQNLKTLTLKHSPVSASLLANVSFCAHSLPCVR
eukprot:jgi/Bigna1/130383/aug1.11_g5091